MTLALILPYTLINIHYDLYVSMAWFYLDPNIDLELYINLNLDTKLDLYLSHDLDQ